MLAILKKELNTYFKSMTGYIFMASLLFFVGLFFVLTNLMRMSPQYNSVLSNITFVFMLIVPILTMRLMAEEAKQKTDQLLLTSPISLPKIVIGKYLGAVSVLLLTLMITFIYPLILSTMGTVNWGEVFGGYIGFFLFGSALIAVGLFISSLTDNQVIAAVATFTVLLLFWFIDAIISSLPADQTSGLIFAAILAAAIAFVFYTATRNWYISGGIFLLGVLAVAAGYFIKPSIYSGLIAKVLSWFSLLSRYQDFSLGIFSISPIVYYISFSSVFVYLTVRMLEKKRWS
ncbi:MAG: ABC transporter permease [Caldicoprobacterales bacterium]|jgi:ABC-2 type transport system permease protein|nr:ABC transporter permease [Clostridiales bacterium]